MDRDRAVFSARGWRVVYIDAIAATNRLSDAMREICRSSSDEPENRARNQTEVRAAAGNILLTISFKNIYIFFFFRFTGSLSLSP